MKKQGFQLPELRDEKDEIIQEGVFGKNTPFTNSTNDGAFDYIINNIQWLYENISLEGQELIREELTQLQESLLKKVEKNELMKYATKEEVATKDELTEYLKAINVYENNMIKLPNGAKIGVE